MGVIGNSTKYQKKSSLRGLFFAFFYTSSPLELNVDVFQSSIEKYPSKQKKVPHLNLRHPLFIF